MPLTLAWSPLYTRAIDDSARFPKARYQLVRDGLEPLVRSGAIRVIEPEPVATADLLRVHDEDYVRRFLEGTLPEPMVRRIGIRPWTPQFVERTRRLVGGTLLALDALLAGGERVAGNGAGGTHHAFRDQGGGYCVFNDVAVACRVALDDHGLDRIAVVDLDVHQGDGTAAIFADEPRVTTISFHARLNYPREKQRSDHDETFEDGATDAEYLARLERVLPPLLDACRPDLIVYQAGVDALAEDALGRLALTRAGLAARNRFVFAEAARLRCPVLVTMGGGYARPLEASIACHVDVFAAAAEHAVSAVAARGAS